MFDYKTLETQIEERLLKQVNKLLIDYRTPPANQLSDASDRYSNSMFSRMHPDLEYPPKWSDPTRDIVVPPNKEYPLTPTEYADLEYYRLLEVVRYEQVPILNLLDHADAVSNEPNPQVPLLYLTPAEGMEPIDYTERNNMRSYVYPVNLRLILNRKQSAFPDLTNTETESLIREGLKYVFDRASFFGMNSQRRGYDIPSRVTRDQGWYRKTLEGFASPWEAFDYELGFVIEEQASLAANTIN